MVKAVAEKFATGHCRSPGVGRFKVSRQSGHLALRRRRFGDLRSDCQGAGL